MAPNCPPAVLKRSRKSFRMLRRPSSHNCCRFAHSRKFFAPPSLTVMHSLHFNCLPHIFWIYMGKFAYTQLISGNLINNVIAPQAIVGLLPFYSIQTASLFAYSVSQLNIKHMHAVILFHCLCIHIMRSSPLIMLI